MNTEFTEYAIGMLKKHGFHQIELVYENYDPVHFGNAEALFRVGSIRMYFLRDRAFDTLEIGSEWEKDTYHICEEVFVLLGIRTCEDVLETLDRQERQDIDWTLSRIRDNFDAIQHLFSRRNLPETRRRLKEISDKLSVLVMERVMKKVAWRKKQEG